MNWGSRDMEMLKKSIDFVDTAVLPLLPFSVGDDMGQALAMTEFISALAARIERQFKGRILLLPGYSYFDSGQEESLVQEVNKWGEELQIQGFKHVFLLTSDAEWRRREERLKGTLIWLPSIPLVKFPDSEKQTILYDQVKQLANLFFQEWQ